MKTYDKYKEGQKCIDILILCGESNGIKDDETPSQYLRRLIDDLILARDV